MNYLEDNIYQLDLVDKQVESMDLILQDSLNDKQQCHFARFLYYNSDADMLFQIKI